MSRRPAVTRPFAVLLVLSLSVSLGCSVNPATGKRQLDLIGEAQEIQLGEQEHKKALVSFGVYPDSELQDYVRDLGEELASLSERPDLPWTFFVVDDPAVNAFALPGGHIYVTRGILAHFNSEAELVSVLGHEIGHVTGRHSVNQMSKAQLASLGLGVAAVATENQYPGLTDLLSMGASFMFLKFSRDDETEADDLGLRYMVRADYDPDEMPAVFQTLGRVTRAEGGGRLPNWASTHPSPENREARLGAQIRELSPEIREGKVERNSYLRRLGGLTFGPNPREGYAVENRFYHPDLRFQLAFPDGWKIDNQKQAVAALSPQQDAMVVLTLAQEDTPEDAARAFFDSGGLESEGRWRPGFYRFHTLPRPGASTLRGLAGFLHHEGRVYQLLGLAVNERWGDQRRALEDSLSSFRKLSDRRYVEVEPKRLAVFELGEPASIAALARSRASTADTRALAILNAVDENETLEAGRVVKWVEGGVLPSQ